MTAFRAFALSSQSAPPLPQPPDLKALWDWGITPREGQLIMVAGRSGSQKSGFVLFWTAMMGLPTLYFSGDMSPFEATSRLVGMATSERIEQIEEGVKGPDQQRYLEALAELPITFSFGQPITFQSIMAELDAHVELYNSYPRVIVIDNLMDIFGCESGYEAQQEAMQVLSALTRTTGSTVIVLHHVTDKGAEAAAKPFMPGSRAGIKNGLSEKPQLILTVALEPLNDTFRVACVKQRSGKSDQSAEEVISLQAYPEITRFGPILKSIRNWETYPPEGIEYGKWKEER